MFTVRATSTFEKWLGELTDPTATRRIAARIVRVEAGNFGDVKSVGGKVSELRVDVGPGYRVYFTRRGQQLILLLCGGDKSTQKADIAQAHAMVAELEKQDKTDERKK